MHAQLCRNLKRYIVKYKELLAIVFGCTKFHQYLYGKEVIVHTDHKPLVSIHKKSLQQLLPRIQRLMLRIQGHNLGIRYVPEKKMFISDTLSRAVLCQDSELNELSESIDVYVNMIRNDLSVTENKYKRQRNLIPHCN